MEQLTHAADMMVDAMGVFFQRPDWHASPFRGD